MSWDGCASANASEPAEEGGGEVPPVADELQEQTPPREESSARCPG